MERDRERWMRLRPILEDLLELAPEEREAVLADRLDSEELRAAARRFLREEEAFDDARDPLARPAVDVNSSRLIASTARTAVGPPERAGPWEFRRRLGAGGMGEVWLAVRTEGGFSQRAAVKRLHAGIADGEVLARFERERAVLGSIEDPSIARLIDGGLDDQGRPYIAMEFVDGEPIDAWCNARQATVRERVELLVRVARCVDAAHERHVVHRDIKPSNVLVDGQGRPRLIDFGVAKVLDPAKDSALVTRDAARYLTPLYASPEQFAGKSPTTASDVYSLGVLAYVLLTGEAPLELTGLGPAESMRIIRDEQPVALAVRAGSWSPEVAEARGTTPKGLVRALDHDLDTVVRYCLRKEPMRRYGRARDLANDLQRWLDGQTVLARKDRWSYRTRRFVSRNRAVVTVTLVAFALLAGALLTVMTQRRDLLAQTEELDQRNAEAQTLIDDLRSTIADSTSVFYPQLAVIPGTSEVLKRMSESLAATASRHDDPRLLTEAVRAYGLVGYGAWAPFASRPGDPEASYAAHTRAEALGIRMLETYAESELMSWIVAEAVGQRATAEFHHGHLEALLEDVPRMRAWLHARLAPDPPRRADVLAAALVNSYAVRFAEARALEHLGRPAEALGCLDEALLTLETSTPEVSIADAIGRHSVAVMERHRDLLALALGATERAGPEPRANGARVPEDMRLRAARLRVEGQLDLARLELIAALQVLEETAPMVLRRGGFPMDLLDVLTALAELELEAGRADDALLRASAALEMLESALGARPTAWIEGERLRQTRLLAGRARIAGGDPVEGARLVGLALDHAKRELERCPRNFFARLSAVDAACELAALQGEAAEAAEWLQRAERILGAAEAGAGTERQLAERHARISALRSGNR